MCLVKKTSYLKKQNKKYNNIPHQTMVIRRSLRLQSRNETINECKKPSIKKIKLPRKRKVNVKRITKIVADKVPRRSTRIKKKNSFYSSYNEKTIDDQIISSFKIEPCEVLLEPIDLLIEKLKIDNKEAEIRGAVQPSAAKEAHVEEDADDVTQEPGNSSAKKITEESSQTEGTKLLTSEGIKKDDVKTAEKDEISEERAKEREEIAKRMMDMLNQYKIQNEIDFDEINNISNNYNEDKGIINIWGKEKQLNGYREKIINNVFFNNTNAYNFKSCFKDRASLTAAFDRHSGQVSNETYPYDITETPKEEKVKRFYRKNISDPNLHSWYQYNVASSRRFSKPDSEETKSKIYFKKYLII